MWLLFHRKAGTKTVRGGQSFTEHCPTCDRTTKFDEIEMSEKWGLWFVVDVVSDKERAFRCRVCGDVFDLRDQPDDKPAAKPTAKQLPQRDRTEELAAEQRRRDAERAAKETRIDDELAELKKRMGR